MVRCVFGDPLSRQSGNEYSAVGWYGETRAYGGTRHAVRLGYTFAEFPICGLPVPCTLESLADCGFCVRVEICDAPLSPQRVVQRMIAMDGAEGLREAAAAAAGGTRWRVYSVREYDESCEAVLFSDRDYREHYKMACEPRLLLRAFAAAVASVTPQCPYLYLGDVAKLARGSGEGSADMRVVVGGRPGPIYCSMEREDLEEELRLLGDDEDSRCLKHYICRLLI